MFESRHAAQLDRLERFLERILTHVLVIEAQEISMDAATQKSIDNLNANVQADTDAEHATQTLLGGLSAQIAALKVGQTDPAVIAAIDAAAAIVGANAAASAAAVVANTPAATS